MDIDALFRLGFSIIYGSTALLVHCSEIYKMREDVICTRKYSRRHLPLEYAETDFRPGVVASELLSTDLTDVEVRK